MRTNQESEAGRRGLFAVFFFVVAAPAVLMGALMAALLVYRALADGPDTSTMAFYFSLGGCVIFVGPAAFCGCIASLLAARPLEERLLRIFWLTLVVTAATLSMTAILG